MMTRDELARQVLDVMDLQQSYFRLRPGDPSQKMALEASKKAERSLRLECERLLKGPSLFREGS